MSIKKVNIQRVLAGLEDILHSATDPEVPVRQIRDGIEVLLHKINAYTLAVEGTYGGDNFVSIKDYIDKLFNSIQIPDSPNCCNDTICPKRHQYNNVIYQLGTEYNKFRFLYGTNSTKPTAITSKETTDDDGNIIYQAEALELDTLGNQSLYTIDKSAAVVDMSCGRTKFALITGADISINNSSDGSEVSSSNCEGLEDGDYVISVDYIDTGDSESENSNKVGYSFYDSSENKIVYRFPWFIDTTANYAEDLLGESDNVRFRLDNTPNPQFFYQLSITNSNEDSIIKLSRYDATDGSNILIDSTTLTHIDSSLKIKDLMIKGRYVLAVYEDTRDVIQDTNRLTKPTYLYIYCLNTLDKNTQLHMDFVATYSEYVHNNADLRGLGTLIDVGTFTAIASMENTYASIAITEFI